MAGSVASMHAPLRYDPVQLLGKVAEIGDDGRITVHCEGSDWQVDKAASCLLQPGVGDLALISGPVPEQVYLIAIVRQANASVARLEVKGDLQVASANGDVTVSAMGAVALRAEQRLDLHSETLDLRTRHAQLAVRELDYLGARARWTVGSVTLLLHACEIIADRVSQVARSVFRLTRETEQVRAAHLDYQAEHTARLHADNTLVTGRHLVKVDADQIHMG